METVLSIILWRWRIETAHKDLKQLFFFEKKYLSEKESILAFSNLSHFFFNLFSRVRYNLIPKFGRLSIGKILRAVVVYSELLTNANPDWSKLFDKIWEKED